MKEKIKPFIWGGFTSVFGLALLAGLYNNSNYSPSTYRDGMSIGRDSVLGNLRISPLRDINKDGYLDVIVNSGKEDIFFLGSSNGTFTRSETRLPITREPYVLNLDDILEK